MIACLYGRAFAPFIEPVVRDLRAAAFAAGGEIQPLTVETALADRERCAAVHRLYVLPFDLPADAGTAGAFVRRLFPRAEVATSFAAQDLCWDKLATQQRLLDRGLPVPETVVSSDPDDVYAFVREHQFAILKERYSCGGQGHVVIWLEDNCLLGDSGSHQFRVELTNGGRRRIIAQRLVYPGPFYVQRLIGDVYEGRIVPGQVLRAYIVDGHILFWTERYRDHYVRPSDCIINVSLGAKYRFLHDVSEEARKIALRTAEVIGLRIGVVDLIRTGSAGPYVLEADTDSRHMIIDRGFKEIPEYRDFFDLDRYIAEALLVEPVVPERRPERRPSAPPPRRGERRPAARPRRQPRPS